MLPPRSRFTLRRLMVLVSLSCVVLAIVRHAFRSWGPGDVTTLSLDVLVATNVLAWFQRARWPVFWAGFGLLGWAYLAIALGPPLGEHLPTTRMLDVLHDRLYSAHAGPTFGDDFDNVAAGPIHAHQFRRAGQSVMSLIVALLGGIGARLLFPAKSDDPQEPPPPDGWLLKPGWRPGGALRRTIGG